MVQGRSGTGNVVALMVRVPEDLRDRIKLAADENGRSQNSEIVATLEEKYPVPIKVGPDLADLYDLMREVALASDEEEQLARLRSANAGLRQTGHGVKLVLSNDLDDRGLRQVFMSIDHGPSE